ncbi:hypothetical protein STCU_12180 [Strigomonas culicis]|uniref:Uncharacterized protein n=1 Tax=Strigomonas culicis TaxID=28005 RepID=S9UKS1_9TRYP|nr:hypothetical protein STCU_12180 [Strigomonas culicis]|eukprot:EPY15266.1 hypothetical protein STCU_12180 [Strigomonas culicis]
MVVLPLHCMALTPTPVAPSREPRPSAAAAGAAGPAAHTNGSPFLQFFTHFLLGLNAVVSLPPAEALAPAPAKLRLSSLSFFSNAMMDAVSCGITHRAVIIHADVRRIVISKMEKGRTARHGTSYVGSLESILSMTPKDASEPTRESMVFTHEALEAINLCEPGFKENLIHCFGTKAYAYFVRQMEKEQHTAPPPVSAKGKGKGKGRRAAAPAAPPDVGSPYGAVNRLLARVVRESPLEESFTAFANATSTAPLVGATASRGGGGGPTAAGGRQAKMAFHTLNPQHTYNSYIACTDRRLPLLITGDALRVKGLYHLLHYVGRQCSAAVLRVVQEERRAKERERSERQRAAAAPRRAEGAPRAEEVAGTGRSDAKDAKGAPRKAPKDRKRRRDASSSSSSDEDSSSGSSDASASSGGSSDGSSADSDAESSETSSSEDEATSDSDSDDSESSSDSDDDSDATSTDSHRRGRSGRKRAWLRVQRPPLPQAPYQCTAIGSAIWSGMMEDHEGERERHRVFAEELQRSAAECGTASTSVLWKAII